MRSFIFSDANEPATAATLTHHRPGPKDLWDKLNIVGTLTGAILIPVGIAVAGFMTNAALQDREVKQKTAEVAIRILETKDDDIPALKAWALTVFDRLVDESGLKLPPAAEEEIRKFKFPPQRPTLPPSIVRRVPDRPGDYQICYFNEVLGKYDQCIPKPRE